MYIDLTHTYAYIYDICLYQYTIYDYIINMQINICVSPSRTKAHSDRKKLGLLDAPPLHGVLPVLRLRRAAAVTYQVIFQVISR